MVACWADGCPIGLATPANLFPGFWQEESGEMVCWSFVVSVRGIVSAPCDEGGGGVPVAADLMPV